MDMMNEEMDNMEMDQPREEQASAPVDEHDNSGIALGLFGLGCAAVGVAISKAAEYVTQTDWYQTRKEEHEKKREEAAIKKAAKAEAAKQKKLAKLQSKMDKINNPNKPKEEVKEA